MSIYRLYKGNNKNTRLKLNLRPKYNPKTKRLKNSLFYKYIELYTEVPEKIKNIPLIKYVKYSIRDYVNEKYDPYTIPDTNDNDSTTDSE